MSSGGSRLPNGWSRGQATASSTRFFHLSHLRKLKGCEQVAAVCYRVRGAGIEFLLVQTRGARWTFPKGSTEAGLTHAQAAALEAFEEAGVHGRIEEASFARYVRRKRANGNGTGIDVAVNAHLCEVSRLDAPQEANRNPSWFSAEKAKRRLQEGRTAEYAAELTRVVDRAVARIQRLHNGAARAVDALQKVHFIDRPRQTPHRTKAATAAAKNRRNGSQFGLF